MTTIAQIMTKSVATVQRDETLQAAAQRMRDMDVGSLPVLDGQAIVGIVTDRDIAVRGVADGMVAQESLVADVMTEEVRCCRADDSIECTQYTTTLAPFGSAFDQSAIPAGSRLTAPRMKFSASRKRSLRRTSMTRGGALPLSDLRSSAAVMLASMRSPWRCRRAWTRGVLKRREPAIPTYG